MKDPDTREVSWIDGTPTAYTNWKPPYEPDRNWICIAESGQGEWWTTNCDRKYDVVICSYTPCPHGGEWIHGRCLLFKSINGAGKTFDEANAFCGDFGSGTNVMEDSQAIIDWVNSNVDGDHWIGAKMVNSCLFPTQ